MTCRLTELRVAVVVARLCQDSGRASGREHSGRLGILLQPGKSEWWLHSTSSSLFLAVLFFFFFFLTVTVKAQLTCSVMLVSSVHRGDGTSLSRAH